MKKKLAIALAAILGASMLAACGSGSSNSAPVSEEPAAEAEAETEQTEDAAPAATEEAAAAEADANSDWAYIQKKGKKFMLKNLKNGTVIIVLKNLLKLIKI